MVAISRNGRDVVLKLRKREPVSSIVEKIKKQAEVRPESVQWLALDANGDAAQPAHRQGGRGRLQHMPSGRREQF